MFYRVLFEGGEFASFEAADFNAACEFAARGESRKIVGVVEECGHDCPHYREMHAHALGLVMLAMPNLPVYVSFQGRKGVGGRLVASIEPEDIRLDWPSSPDRTECVHLFMD